MGQKVHPYGFRLGITTDHRSQWFSDSTKAGERYSHYVAEDVRLRRFLQDKLDRAGVSHMVIRRTRDRVNVDVHVARPGVAIGRQGTGLDKLRDEARELTGKTVIVASTRGGMYANTEGGQAMEHQESYLKVVLGFFGITDVRIVRAEGLAMGEQAKAAALDAARVNMAQATA